MIQRFAILITSLFFVFAANAGDLGFRFNGTACVDKTGKTGLNPGFFGQCGDLRHLVVSGLSLDGLDMSGAMFDDSDFNKTSFAGGILNNASFAGANLSGANLTSATIHNSIFVRAIMVNAHLGGADLQNDDFSSADLSGQVLSTMKLSGNIFVGSHLAGAELDSTDLTNCDLSSADLSNANLETSKLDGSKLSGASLGNADLTKATLTKITANSASFSHAILRMAIMDGAQMPGAVMNGAQMDQVSLKAANLTQADLRRAVLTGAIIDGATFTGAQINKGTVLDITPDAAKKLGMILDTSAGLLVIYEIGDSDVVTLVANFQKMGMDVTLSPEDSSTFTGDVDLSNYSAVLHLTSLIQTDMPAGGQTALVNFVKSGGVYISTGSLSYYQSQSNFFLGMPDLSLYTYANAVQNANLQLTIASGASSNPVLKGVSAPLSFANMNYIVGTQTSFATNPSKVLLTDAQNEPIVVTRDVGSGHVVGMSLGYPGQSFDLEAAGFQQLIFNAANWQ